MNRLACLALVSVTLLSGCATTRPKPSPGIKSTRLPEVHFTNARLGDVLEFLIERTKDLDPNRPFRPSIIVDWKKSRQEFDLRLKRYNLLQQYCGNRLISLKLEDCGLFDLIDFVTRCVGVEYQVDGYDIIIKTLDGDILFPQEPLPNN